MNSGRLKPVLQALSRHTLPLLFAVGGGYLYVLALPRGGFAEFLTLMVFGLWAACMLHTMGWLKNATFFALGFSVIINPRKFFGMPPALFKALTYGEARYQFLSFTDLSILIIVVLLLLGQLPGKKRSDLSLPTWTIIAVTGYWLISGASYFGAPDKGRALAQMAFDAKLMGIVLVLSRVFSDRQRLYTYLPVFLYGVLAACVLEFFVVTVEYTRIINFGHIVILGIPLGMGVQEQMLGVSAMFRISGTYGHANYLGAAMGCVALVVWEILIANYSILQRCRNIVWVAWGLVSAVFLLSFSRGAWLGMAVPTFLYFPLALKVQGRAWLKAFFKRYASTSVFAVVVMLVIFWQPLSKRIIHSNPSAMTARRLMNNVSRDVIAKRPYFGGGIGNHIALTEDNPFIGASSRFINAPMPVHNMYLMIGTEVGIVGAFFYFMIPVSLVTVSILRCLRNATDPLAPVCLAFASTAIIFWITDRFSPVTRQINCSYLYWTMLAIAAGTLRLLGEDTGEQAIQQITPQPAQTGTMTNGAI